MHFQTFPLSKLCILIASFSDELEHCKMRQSTYDEGERRSRKLLDQEIEEDPRSYHHSPTPRSCSKSQDDLTNLLDTVLEAQDKYKSLYPNMKYLINEKG